MVLLFFPIELPESHCVLLTISRLIFFLKVNIDLSLGNFSTNEVGEPILDVVLEAGDLLYFPRGTIHQVSSKNVTTRQFN